MRTIYHLVNRSDWERGADQPYRADSLASEGFIHCSNAEQVAAAANRFYANATDLCLLHIDSTRLKSPLLDEPAADGELFPHIHGTINRDAVIVVQPLERGADGKWTFAV